MDRLSADARSRLMSRVASHNTKPERAVRSMLHRLGFRFRLHRRDLPGTPDIVLPGRKTVVFVHGCFWHGHACKIDKMPKSRIEYWDPKIRANRERDHRNARRLRVLGWHVLTVWECELKKPQALERRVVRFFEGRNF